MYWSTKTAIALAASAVLLSAFANTVQAGAPTEQVRQTADKVLQVLQDPQFKSNSNAAQRRDQLTQILASRFDFAEMAKRSLGANWQKGSAAEQQQFVRLFTNLLENSYIGQIEAYSGEKINYGRESVEQNQADVETKIVTKKGEEVSVNYKLKADGGNWKVYDVVIENVSLVNNFRNQFNRMLAKGSFADLITQLETKSTIKPERS
ncbi:MAG TPA: ABC transporter substrate-binding protein [Candidatus Binatia bacterium]|nr:ABC transporter substrate-binding protein [Candidatus Binatia bacterium]